jgi:hypothetical protein
VLPDPPALGGQPVRPQACRSGGRQDAHTTHDVMKAWMEEHEYESVQQMQGSMSQRKVAHPKAFLRANYLKVLSSYAMRA